MHICRVAIVELHVYNPGPKRRRCTTGVAILCLDSSAADIILVGELVL